MIELESWQCLLFDSVFESIDDKWKTLTNKKIREMIKRKFKSQAELDAETAASRLQMACHYILFHKDPIKNQKGTISDTDREITSLFDLWYMESKGCEMTSEQGLQRLLAQEYLAKHELQPPVEEGDLEALKKIVLEVATDCHGIINEDIIY